MNVNEKEKIRQKVRNLHRKVRAFRDEWLSPDLNDFQVLRATPDVIVTRILEYDLRKVEEILSDSEGFEVAGTIDRQKRRIEISQRPKFETRRFTLAHEIAHAFLHPGITYHRDRPADGSSVGNYKKPRTEQEADVFAGELLMPLDLVMEAFVARFGGRIDRRDVDDNFAFNLNLATGEGLSARQISRLRPYELALRIAAIPGFGPNLFEPLAKLFGVSRSAMAYQLTEHHFVA